MTYPKLIFRILLWRFCWHTLLDSKQCVHFSSRQQQRKWPTSWQDPGQKRKRRWDLLLNFNIHLFTQLLVMTCLRNFTCYYLFTQLLVIACFEQFCYYLLSHSFISSVKFPNFGWVWWPCHLPAKCGLLNQK